MSEEQKSGSSLDQSSFEEATDSRSIEAVFEELENILSGMQDPDVTLEESFRLYEKGMQDIKSCNKMLGQMEKRMEMLTEDGTLEPFEAE